MKKKDEVMRLASDELVSLNENLHSEFTIMELEERLETDPLMLAVASASCDFTCEDIFGCGCFDGYIGCEKIKN